MHSSKATEPVPKQVSPIPFDFVIWTAEECAEYLSQSLTTFLKRTQYVEGFPARLPVPGHPRWQARAVANWAISGPVR